MDEVDTGVWVRLGAGDGDEVGVWVGALVRVGDGVQVKVRVENRAEVPERKGIRVGWWFGKG